MSIICPTITIGDPHGYREQVERASLLSRRIHIDLMDGEFAPTKSLNPVQVWWPEDITADIHLMYKRPSEHLETLVSLHPHMVILHVEAEGNLIAIIEHLKKFDILVGVALLAETRPELYADIIKKVDHVLVFSGSLGTFGGTVDFKHLTKIAMIRALNPEVEIGWDGGINESNIARLAEGGVDVLNVGGAIQRSDDPKGAYATLVAKLPTT